MPRLSLIAAVARNRVIGRGNTLPWRLPADMAFFKDTTLGKPVIMGRRTWGSLGGRPLPGRTNIVLSHDPGFRPEGAEVRAGFASALVFAKQVAARDRAMEIMVIGGERLFCEALPLADRIYLTEVMAEPEGDAYFPDFDRGGWTETLVAKHGAEGAESPAFKILVLDRRR